MIKAPKGTKDILPSEVYKWQFVEETARKVASLYNVKEIRTPVFEHTEVFLRGVGETTDIVNKEMYTFLDKGERSITLKPEGTAGVARAFVENGLHNLALPVKLYYITPCFRYERPQAGRLREFHQFGVEFLGSSSAETDAEAIVLAKSFLNELKVDGVKLYINSIGCKNCRSAYQKALKEYYAKRYDELCPLCKERFEKNPLRLLDCKNEQCGELAKGAPSILDYLCEECDTHFTKVKNYLTALNVEYEVKSDIVRGLDYYTKTVFEFVSVNIGAQGTVLGGGRYDGLIEGFDGGNHPGVGFALGIERLLLLMENTGKEFKTEDCVKIYVAPMGEKAYVKAMELVYSLRNCGVKAETDHMQRGVKAQFKYADKIGAKYVVVIGENELINNSVRVKEMATGVETEVSIDNVKEFIINA